MYHIEIKRLGSGNHFQIYKETKNGSKEEIVTWPFTDVENFAKIIDALHVYPFKLAGKEVKCQSQIKYAINDWINSIIQ